MYQYSPNDVGTRVVGIFAGYGNLVLAGSVIAIGAWLLAFSELTAFGLSLFGLAAAFFIVTTSLRPVMQTEIIDDHFCIYRGRYVRLAPTPHGTGFNMREVLDGLGIDESVLQIRSRLNLAYGEDVFDIGSTDYVVLSGIAKLAMHARDTKKSSHFFVFASRVVEQHALLKEISAYVHGTHCPDATLWSDTITFELESNEAIDLTKQLA